MRMPTMAPMHASAMRTMIATEVTRRRRCLRGSCQPERRICSAPPSSPHSLASSSCLGLGFA